MFDPLEAVKEFIRHASVSTDPQFNEGMVGARNHVVSIFESMGLEVEVIPTPLHPIVMAKRKGPESWPHILIYGHYDVQPSDPDSLWTTPPFEPVIKEDGRLYGRGAADNKGPMMVHIAAAARFLEAHPDAPLRLTFIIEGEEEIGSPSFPKVLEDYKDELSADFVLLSDTLSPSKDQIAITTGLRGIVSIEVFLKGPKSDLHSGIHGGAVYNPIQALTEICASLHNSDGSVNVPGFYDAVILPEEWEKEEISKLGNDMEAYRKSLDVPELMKQSDLTPFQATRFLPTLEFNGITGGYQGKGEKTIIPSEASTKISCRLVANQDPIQIMNSVIGTIKARCPKSVSIRVEQGHYGPAYQVVPPRRPNTPEDQNPHLAKAFDAADAAIGKAFGKPPLYLREGGSVPIIGEFKSKLGIDSLMIGMFTPIDNLHAPNEGFDLEMFQNGIQASEAILKSVAGV